MWWYNCGDLWWGFMQLEGRTRLASFQLQPSALSKSIPPPLSVECHSIQLTCHLKIMESSPSPLPGSGQGEPSPAASPIPDRRSPSPELPLTMTASAVLSNLPRDATSAIASAGQFSQEKILVRFKPVGAAPSLSREVCKISAAQKFEAVVAYLRRVLKVKDTDSVFLYVNSAFAPSLDEIVGNLHRVSRDLLRSTLPRDS